MVDRWETRMAEKMEFPTVEKTVDMKVVQKGFQWVVYLEWTLAEG